MSRATVVIPVYDAYEDVSRCLASVAACRGAEEVVLVDDGSTDPRIAPLLKGFAAAHPGVRLLRQANRGYIAAANAGATAAAADSDLLFLNSDTVVTPGWLEQMRLEQSRSGAAIVCPLTSNGNFLSVPRFMQPNALPAGWEPARMAALLRQCADDAGLQTIELPTAVGFCMLVDRGRWEAFGPFDPSYGRGYGEEDEFAQRVRDSGGRITCATRAYVWHRGGSSFAAAPPGDARVANMRLLMSRWPRYTTEATEFTRTNPLRPLQERLWEALLDGGEPGQAHVLHILPHWETAGPLRARTLTLLEASAGVAIHTVVVPVAPAAAGHWIDAIDHEAGEGWRVCGVLAFDASFARFLAASPATLVHVHGPGTHAAAAVAAARRLARPAIATEEAPDVQRCLRTYARYARGSRTVAGKGHSRL